MKLVNPKISVITPSFNQAEFLEETILSVIGQNYPNLEYMVIDGGSTDNSVEIIKKYEQHLTYWVSEKDNGQSEAINKGFKRATGDIVCWLNSDDVLLPGSLNKVAKFFENNDADLLNGYLLIIDKDSRILSNFFVLRAKKRLAKKGIYYMTQQSMFWKRNIFEKVGFLRDDFHALMDQEFLIRVFEKDLKIGHIEKILGAIRRHEMAKSSILGPIWSEDRKKLNVMYNGSYGQKPAMMSKLLYGIEKLMNGLYFKHWAFIRRWKGRKINDLEKENCVYL